MVKLPILLLLLFALRFMAQSPPPPPPPSSTLPTPLSQAERVYLLQLSLTASRLESQRSTLLNQFYTTPEGQQFVAVDREFRVRTEALNRKLADLQKAHNAAGKSLDGNLEWTETPKAP